MQKNIFDVVVIGGGIAGIAAANAAFRGGATVAILEREAKLGGILKQCVHDGFGVVRYNKKLTGPEYAQKEIDKLNADIKVFLLTFVTKISKNDGGYSIFCVNRDGVIEIGAKKIVLAMGCRERTSKQIGVHGTNPAGVITAGTAQNYINLMGLMPTKKCVILGSGDIGLIMARRLTLEGAKVIGVFEAKPNAGGLMRNIQQCLYDFDIPLHLSRTVTRVFGEDRLSAVEVASVDEKMKPIKGTEEINECDALILSVGLIPENEIAAAIGAQLSPFTKGAVVDQTLETMIDGVFECGNALHVNDLADYVSESGETAGEYAALTRGERKLISTEKNKNIAYVVPQKINLNAPLDKIIVYFRVSGEMSDAVLTVKADEKEVLVKKYNAVRPPEMERIELNLSKFADCHAVSFDLESAK